MSNFTSTIQHIIVMPSNLDEKKFTFFQGFSKEIAEDYEKILAHLSISPHDLLETRLGYKSLVISKLIGSSLDVKHVNESLLEAARIEFERPDYSTK